MKEQWLFLQSGACGAAYNMALDEALLSWVSAGLIPPVLRFYQWNKPTLSLGYFQKAEKEIDLEAIKAYDISLVRRQTGGKAVLHEHELTYSIIVPESHPKMPKTVTEAYRVISEGLRLGFQSLGIDASFAVPKTKKEKEALIKPHSAVCFETPSYYELVVDGKKIAGSAQTRQLGVILQHGSILLDIDLDKMFDLFRYSSDAIRKRAKEKFTDRAATLSSLLHTAVPLENVQQAFKEGFAEALNIAFIPYSLDEKQEREVKKIAHERYESDEWTFMR